MADLTSAQRNKINLTMRQTPWYQDWFRSKGLDPNRVKLSDQQRSDLSSLAARNGMPLTDGLVLDQAGNVNVKHGFAGQPGWLKALEIGGAVAGSLLIPGSQTALGHVFGFGSTQAPIAGATQTLPTLTAVNSGAPIVAVGHAAAAPVAANVARNVGSFMGMGGGGFSVGDIVKSAVGPAIASATGLITSRSQTRSADRGLQAELDAQREAAALQSKSAADQLQYLKDVEAERKKEFDASEARNYGIYQDERDYDRNVFNQRQARLSPYRAIGSNALAAFGRPIGQVMGI